MKCTETTQLLKRTAAVLAAIAVTVTAAWYAAGRAEENVRLTGAGSAEKQVIILDAGHGECS